MIRRATAADADAIWPLTREFATSFTPDRDKFDAAFEALVECDDAFLAVGTTASGAVGYVLAIAHPTLFADMSFGAPEIQIARLMKRDHCTAEEAKRRIESQLSFEEKKAHADWVIDTSGEKESTLAETDRLVEEIKRRAAGGTG